MDTSNSDLKFVRYGQAPRKVNHDVLNVHQWMRLILDLMGMQHPYKKYLPVLRDHRHAVSEICRVSNTRSTFDSWEPEHMFYKPVTPPPSLSKDTRLLPLIPLYTWKANKLNDYSDEAWVKGVLKEDYLLFGLGCWVKLRRLLTMNESSPRSYVVRVRSFTFSELDQEGLIAAIGERTDRWCMLYDALQALMAQAVQQKRRHMEQMERSYKAGAEVRERIHLPLPTF